MVAVKEQEQRNPIAGHVGPWWHTGLCVGCLKWQAEFFVIDSRANGAYQVGDAELMFVKCGRTDGDAVLTSCSRPKKDKFFCWSVDPPRVLGTAGPAAAVLWSVLENIQSRTTSTLDFMVIVGVGNSF